MFEPGTRTMAVMSLLDSITLVCTILLLAHAVHLPLPNAWQFYFPLTAATKELVRRLVLHRDIRGVIHKDVECTPDLQVFRELKDSNRSAQFPATL